MKSLITCFFCFLTLRLLGQASPETEVKTNISSVTVYLSGAQVTRIKSIDLPAGRSTLKFIALSPYIDPKSLNVSVKGDLTVLSVNHQLNYLSQQKASSEDEQLTSSKKEIERKIELERAYVDILQQELLFLKANISIGGNNAVTSINSIKEADTYFTDKFTAIRLKEIERQNTIEQLTKELEKINNQLNALAKKKELPSGEILVSVETKSATKASFDIKYLVKNAGWSPSYDIRVKDISTPASLTYKANVHQNTSEDWNNVSLRLSTSDPSSVGTFRDLKTYYLNYNAVPPKYNADVSQVSGTVYDSGDKTPIPGATVLIKGTSIGTITDMNGQYNLTVPQSGGTLQVSFIGFKSVDVPIRQSQIDINLEAEVMALEEVVVTGYAIEGALAGRIAGVSVRDSNQEDRSSSRKKDEIPNTLIETEQFERQTNMEFEIKTPYTIPSNGKILTIDIENYSIPSIYKYFCTPKIEKSAYLLASIVDWEKYNLIEGEANVYFEDTYTGKSLLDVRYMTDTLTISLGIDKGISISRESQKQFTTRQFIGSKKEETRSWLITVKNNKQQEINLTIYDQIPVSTLEEIEVTPLNLSDGKLNAETGRVKWEFLVNPAEKKEMNLKYSVKYPKFRKLVIE
jgi:hypothetical protein